MKSVTKTESIQKKYLRRLLKDRSVEDVMPLFTRAMSIFRLGNAKKKKTAGK